MILMSYQLIGYKGSGLVEIKEEVVDRKAEVFSVLISSVIKCSNFFKTSIARITIMNRTKTNEVE